MGNLRILCVFMILATAIFGAAASASLIPTSFGFPVIAQTGTTTAFNQDTAIASDLESLNIGFPTSGDAQGLSSGITAAIPSTGGLNMFRSSLSAPTGISSLTSMFNGGSFFNIPTVI